VSKLQRFSTGEISMMRLVCRGTITGIFAGAWVLFGGVCRAQELPKAETLLDKYVAVTGGKEAYDKCNNRLTKGTMEIVGAGLKGELAIYHARPNKMYLEVTFPGLGKIEQGTDGQTVWERNAITGARILQGEEKTSRLRDAVFNEEVEWRKQYKKAECVGEETIEGKPCYKVNLTPAEGQVVTKYLDKESGLEIKTVTTVKTQMGDLPTEALHSDYKKVDGILVPHKLHQKALAQQIVISIDKVQHNIEMPAGRFDLPEDIKKLAEKEKKDKDGPKK
jgi:hypothetical protein